MRFAIASLATVVALGALGGCSVVWPRVEMADTRPAMAQTPPPVAVVDGAIFKADRYRPLWEDHRARLVGDSLVVQIVEKVSASQKSTSSIDKSGTLAAAISALPNVPATKLANLSSGATSANTFAGKGATESSNDFSGTITVVVRNVLPNGHLMVTGEKQIGVNENVDVLRFSGQVDPRAIQTGNTVQSTQIANVRLEHRGRGQQAEANAAGWLSRVFLSVAPL